MSLPRVSVIITVYNRERFIADAVQSILDQTYRNFELIIVDDGSTDRTVERITSFPDRRVRLVRHQRNLGIPFARNTGLDEAAGTFIAWLDSDDIARRHRLENQIRFLDSNPSVAMVGSCAGKIDGGGARKSGVRVPPLTYDDIKCWLLFRSAFQQSSIIGRAEILKQYRYRAEFPVCEDVDMFVRLTRRHQVRNLPEVLIDRRLHQGQIIRNQRDAILRAQTKISMRLLDDLGVAYNSDDARKHVMLGGSFEYRPDLEYLRWAEDWLVRLLDANFVSKTLSPAALQLCASFLWIRACSRSVKVPGRSRYPRRMLASPLTRGIVSKQAGAWLGNALPLMAGIL
ncbi:MAG: glycosyltransferase [Thermoflexales bacterium]